MLAAHASLLGFDGWAFLTTTDPAEALVREALYAKAAEVRAHLDENLANRIANAVRKLFK